MFFYLCVGMGGSMWGGGGKGYGGQRSFSSLVPQEPLTLRFETSSLTRFWSELVRSGCLASDPSGQG